MLDTDAIRIESWLSDLDDRSLALDVLEAACDDSQGVTAKFTRSRVAADFGAAGLELDRWYPDSDGLFALSLAARV